MSNKINFRVVEKPGTNNLYKMNEEPRKALQDFEKISGKQNLVPLILENSLLIKE